MNMAAVGPGTAPLQKSGAGGEEFCGWLKFFELCPVVLKYVQNIFPGEKKFAPGYGPVLGQSRF